MGRNILTFNCLLLAIVVVHIHGQNEASQNETTPCKPECPMEVSDFNGTLYATCEVTPVPKLPLGPPKIYGRVLFKQVYPDGMLRVMVNLSGMPTVERQLRGIHIHRYGDLSNGLQTAGPHYNPLVVNHPSHPGDLGNFGSCRGMIRSLQWAPGATLFGGQSVLGRAVVVHEKEDDMGEGPNKESRRSGNAGRRVAGCVIGLTSPSLWGETIEVVEDEEC